MIRVKEQNETMALGKGCSCLFAQELQPELLREVSQ